MLYFLILKEFKCFLTSYYKMNFIDDNNKYNLINIINHIRLTHDLKFISKSLNVANGTVLRWIQLNKVPYSYCFQILKLANIDIDYSRFSFRDKDQFYTPITTAQYCFKKTKDVIKSYNDDHTTFIYLEPSAGSGSFFDILPKNRRIGIDIEPRNPLILKQDFFDWKHSTNKKYIVIGNPPFGLRGQLALKFINHSQFADYVCFILPQLFESDGKGVPRKRVKGFNLIHSEKLNSSFHWPHGHDVSVKCIFQIWSKHHTNPDYAIKQLDNSVLKVYSLSDGGTPSTTRNKNMFYNCPVYLPSTCYGEKNMTFYNSFDELPRRKGYGIVFHKDIEINIQKFKSIIWSNIAFLSTNSAYNIRSSQIIQQFP